MREYKIALAVSLVAAILSFLGGAIFGGLSYVALIAIGVASFLVYIAPIVAAYHRNHPQAGAITLLTILLGWTFLGWVMALVWANISPPNAIAVVPPSDKTPTPLIDTRKCPYCAEMIKAEAIKCRYCASAVEPAPITQTADVTQ